MKVNYDPERDGLRILLSEAPITHTTDEAGGLILDYDNNGMIVGIEMLDASLRMTDPCLVKFDE